MRVDTPWVSGVGNRERSNPREAAIHEKFGSIDDAAIVGAAGLAAARAAGLGLPRPNRRFREPHGQAAALAQGAAIAAQFVTLCRCFAM